MTRGDYNYRSVYTRSLRHHKDTEACLGVSLSTRARGVDLSTFFTQVIDIYISHRHLHCGRDMTLVADT